MKKKTSHPRQAEDDSQEQPTEAKVYTQNEVDAIVAELKEAAKQTVKDVVSQANSRGITPVIEHKDLRPVVDGRSGIPKEHFNAKGLRVYRNGKGGFFTFFQIGGRVVDIPTAKMLMFRNDPMHHNTFGRGADMVYRSYFETNDQRLIDLFLQDDRMHKELWLESGMKLSIDERFGKEYGDHKRVVDTMAQAAIHAELVQRRLEVGGTLADMRVRLTTARTKEAVAAKAGAYVGDLEKAKEQLLKAG